MSNYIHGSAPEEQARLAKLNELINDRCLHLLDIHVGNHILDVGSGLGQFTSAMAALIGEHGKCLGIERDKNQLQIAVEQVKLKNIEYRQGNAENLMLQSNEWSSFDLAHARFVLEHVKQPENVVAGMAKAVKQGGKVVLADDDHELLRLHPEPVGFSIIWHAYIRSYDRLGNDPYIGRKLITLLQQAGLRRIKNNSVFFGDCSATETFAAYVSNLIGILEGARELMLKQTLIDLETFEEAIRQIRIWSLLPDAALWYTINWAEGTKP